MKKVYWALNSTDPRNRIGKHILPEVYDSAARGYIDYKIIFGPSRDTDLIAINRKIV